MSLKFICSCMAVLILFTSTAQTQRLKFSSINTGGLIVAEKGLYGMFQTVNGFLYKKWFGGVGLGYDYHYYKSIPLFIDARRYIGKENNWLFYADIGYNFPYKNIPKSEARFYTSFDFKGGFYSDIGVGYGINFKKNTTLLLAGGYSYKNINSRIRSATFCINPPCPENSSDYDYDFNRILIKAGIQFK